MDLLEANRNQRGIRNWEKLGAQTGGLTSFGLGLTPLRKLARQVGRDHDLALELWNTDSYDARVISLLIDEPSKLTREQVEAQVENVGMGLLSHVFSACGATLAKAPFAFDLAQAWIQSEHVLRRRCGYGLVYELSKDRRNKALTDAFFLLCIRRISEHIANEDPGVKASMGGALIGIGKRNRVLNQAAIQAAKAIGPIDYNDAGSTHEPMEVLKHLTSESLQKKL